MGYEWEKPDHPSVRPIVEKPRVISRIHPNDLPSTTTNSQITSINTNQQGVWIVYWRSVTGVRVISIHSNELGALRAAVADESGQKVCFIPWGADVQDTVYGNIHAGQTTEIDGKTVQNRTAGTIQIDPRGSSYR